MIGGHALELDRGAIEGNGPAALAQLKERLLAEQPPAAIGHRIVHGGPHHVSPAIIDDALLAELHRLTPLAPLHIPVALELVEAACLLFSAVLQVVCFDTAFHARMPPVARHFPLPGRFYARGVRRYGFHGLSYSSIVAQLASDLPARLVIAHLGNGASMVAVRDGVAVDTTMGMTPAGGFAMGGRSGDLDPGALVYLMREEGYSADGIEELVNNASGLYGISGHASDLRELLALDDEPSRAAIDLFCYTARKALGSLVAVLGGCDLLVFTGGIGENLPLICERIADGVPGIERTTTLPADEERVIAQETSQLKEARCSTANSYRSTN